MRRIYSLIGCLMMLCCALSAQKDARSLAQALTEKGSKNLFVVAHRGDWRNAPENSLQAFKNCIEMGVHMIEIDLKMTKDKQLILMHDNTIDRTTNGKGRPSDYTLEEIRQFRLKNGLGRVTPHVIPTLEEVLELCKGKILINIDKGYDYFKEAYALTEQTQTTHQIVIKSGFPLAKVKAENGEILNKVIYMPIVSLDKTGAEQMIDEYLEISPVAIECCFEQVTPEVIRLLKKIKDSGTKIWINSLWPSLNAGHDDDRAVEQGEADQTWGWILSQGATLIQTDRPAALLEYLNDASK